MVRNINFTTTSNNLHKYRQIYLTVNMSSFILSNMISYVWVFQKSLVDWYFSWSLPINDNEVKKTNFVIVFMVMFLPFGEGLKHIVYEWTVSEVNENCLLAPSSWSISWCCAEIPGEGLPQLLAVILQFTFCINLGGEGSDVCSVGLDDLIVHVVIWRWDVDIGQIWVLAGCDRSSSYSWSCG